jgi:hypothetical protein
LDFYCRYLQQMTDVDKNASVRSTLYGTTARKNLEDTFHHTQRRILDDAYLSRSMSSNFHHAKMETLRKHEEKAIAMGLRSKPNQIGTPSKNFRTSSPAQSSVQLILSNFTTTKSKPNFDTHYHRNIINQVKQGKGNAYSSFKSHLDHCHVYVNRSNSVNKNEKPTKQRIKWTQRQVEMRQIEKEKEDFVYYNQQMADPKFYQTIRAKGVYNDGLKHERVW